MRIVLGHGAKSEKSAEAQIWRDREVRAAGETEERVECQSEQIRFVTKGEN